MNLQPLIATGATPSPGWKRESLKQITAELPPTTRRISLMLLGEVLSPGLSNRAAG